MPLGEQVRHNSRFAQAEAETGRCQRGAVCKEDVVGSIQEAVRKERMQSGCLQRGCQRQQTKVVGKKNVVGSIQGAVSKEKMPSGIGQR